MELDLTALQAAVEAALAVDPKPYTTDSYAGLAEALAAAQAILEDGGTQAEVDAAAAALNAALEALAELDLTALQAAVEAALDVDPESYTADSYAGLAEPLAAAQAILEDGGTQAEVDAAAEALTAALDALVHTHMYDCPGKNFTDMPAEDNWAHDPIDWAVVNDITNGVSATLFGVKNTCTRGQVVTFLWRAAGSPEPEGKLSDLPFTDVKAGAYYEKAVVWAVENHIASGVSRTAFGPGKTANRGQVVTFLWRAAGSPEPEQVEVSFTDVRPKAYYYQAMLWAISKGITNGTSASAFSPDKECTRAQVVTFLYRAQE